MPGNDDDLTEDEVKRFEALTDEETATLARYLKWRENTQKKSDDGLGNDFKRGDGRKSPNAKDDKTSTLSLTSLEDLETLIQNPRRLSILRHLIAEHDRSTADLETKKKKSDPEVTPIQKILRVL